MLRWILYVVGAIVLVGVLLTLILWPWSCKSTTTVTPPGATTQPSAVVVDDSWDAIQRRGAIARLEHENKVKEYSRQPGKQIRPVYLIGEKEAKRSQYLYLIGPHQTKWEVIRIEGDRVWTSASFEVPPLRHLETVTMYSDRGNELKVEVLTDGTQPRLIPSADGKGFISNPDYVQTSPPTVSLKVAFVDEKSGLRFYGDQNGDPCIWKREKDYEDGDGRPIKGKKTSKTLGAYWAAANDYNLLEQESDASTKKHKK